MVVHGGPMLVIPSLPPYFLINIPQLHKRVGYQAGFDSPQTHAYTLELFGPSEVYAPHEWHFTHLVTTVVDTGFSSISSFPVFTFLRLQLNLGYWFSVCHLPDNIRVEIWRPPKK